jgi:hypothetical protein
MTRVYIKKKIIGFVWDYPFQLDDFENDICNTIKRKQMADFI